MGDLRYLEGNPANIYATRELGNTFYNAAIGLAMERNRQANRAAELAFQERELAAKLPIYEAQQRNYAAEAAWHQARTKQAEAEALTASQQQRGSAATGRLTTAMSLDQDTLGRLFQNRDWRNQMNADLQASGAGPMGPIQVAPITMADIANDPMLFKGVPEPSLMEPIPHDLLPMIRAAVYGNTMGTAVSSPAGAASVVNPVEGSQYGLYNKVTGAQVVPPMPGVMSPYQNIMARNARDREVLGLISKSFGQQGDIDRKGFDAANNIAGQMFPDFTPLQNPVPPPAPKTYASEKEARAAGNKKGAKVYITGVGLVELH